MTKLKLIGVALVVSAIPLTAVWAQVSEPAAAAARDPNFSIYSSGPPRYGAPAAMAQSLPEEAWEPQVPVRSHRARHQMRRY